MKLSTSTNIMFYSQGVPGEIQVDLAVKACAEAGFRHVDANLCGFCRPGRPLTQDNWEKWVHDTRDLGDELGIDFSQAHAYYARGNEFNSDGTYVDGQWGEELMRRSVLAAEILGAKWMVVHPYSVLHHGWYDYKKSFECNCEYFKRWVDFFAEHNVGMAIENMNMPVKYCSCGEELLELVDTINHPMAGICIDTGHAHASGVDVPNLVRQVGSYLKATHIADNHANKDEHFAPFNGTIDWPETMKALKEIKYQECFAFEIHNLTSMYPKEVQTDLVKFSYALGQYLINLA